MSGVPISALLPDGQRLHLNHGPIDLIIGAEGVERDEAFQDVTERFNNVLTGLVGELDALKVDYEGHEFSDPVARRMADAVSAFSDAHFVTPMAAVAGAVADEMLATLAEGRTLRKAYVNNGGDIAFTLSEGEVMRVATPTGQIDIQSTDPFRGIATSGWRGRSFSLGIADAVTVLAKNAALADAAATLIANHVDLPMNAKIKRLPAHEVEVHSELGDRLVTVDVAKLDPDEVESALDAGCKFAQECLSRKLITAAVLGLQGETRIISDGLYGQLQR